MCRDKNVLGRYLKHSPQRESCHKREELQFLLDIVQENEKTKVRNNFYTDVIISNKDYIIPTKNQIHFWEDNGQNFTIHSGYHFIFYDYPSWDDLLAFYSS